MNYAGYYRKEGVKEGKETLDVLPPEPYSEFRFAHSFSDQLPKLGNILPSL